MMNDQCGIQGQHEHSYICFKRISWTALFVGALVAMGLGFLLNLFGIAIGLSLVTTTKEGMVTLAVGGLMGLAISTIVANYVGGYAAGYLGRPFCVRRNLGMLYGFTSWCVALILIALLMSNLGRYAASYSSFVRDPRMIVVVTDDGKETAAPAKMTATVKPAKPAEAAAVAVNNQRSAMSVGMGAMLIFILFFLGAISSAFGGHCGMGCRENSSR